MESNDTLLTATQTGIDAGELGEFTFNGVIGDNPDTGDADDVDLYALELAESTRVAFDIDTNNSDPDSFFDSILRVFDSEGNEVAVNDDSNNADSFIGFQPPAAGTYYVGVSGFSNFDYDPSVLGSSTNSNSTGNYDLTITTFESTTSGFTGGAKLLKDISTTDSPYGDYPAGSYASNLTEFDGKLLFTANGGVTGNELWVSDGTADGTQLLKDINTTDSPYGLPSSYASNFTEFDGKLLFAANDGVTGNELWVSDGTADGTQLLKDINTTDSPYGDYPAGSNASNFTEFDGKLLFTANDGVTGNELWVSDGTADGTQLLKDINVGDSGYFGGLSNLTVAGDFLFFAADDGFTGQELWISDGTAAGTQLFQDINPGANGSNPGSLNVFGDQLLFTANDGTTGNELWTATIPDNLVIGDENDNVLNGTTGNDFIDGLAGNDVIRSRRGNDLLNGGSGDDDLFGDAGDDTLNGNDDNDRLFGSQGNDDLRGGAGNDQLFGGRGQDTLQAGAGDDVVRGNAGDDTVIVTDFSGIDSFNGGSGNDLIRFEPTDGRDLTILLDQGAVGDGRQTFTNFEEITTGRGNDRLIGNNEDNTFNSGDGNDELRGNAGQDQLNGGLGADILLGGRGADILEGGIGNDVLIGEGGADIFLFADDLLDGLADTDTIQDFQSRDILDFSAYVDAGGSIGATRVTSRFLRLDLSGEDTVDIFGSASALDAAEAQIL